MLLKSFCYVVPDKILSDFMFLWRERPYFAKNGRKKGHYELAGSKKALRRKRLSLESPTLSA